MVHGIQSHISRTSTLSVFSQNPKKVPFPKKYIKLLQFAEVKIGRKQKKGNHQTGDVAYSANDKSTPHGKIK